MTKNRWLIAASALSVALAACNVATKDNTATPQAEGTAPAAVEKLAVVQMNPDTSFLNAEEKQVVNLLIQAAGQMSEIYKRQVASNYDEIRAQIANGNDPNKEALLAKFDANFGPWDSLDEDKPFFGTAPKPPGGGFYPADLTKEAFDAYLKANPGEEEALTSPYTVVRRQGDKLIAVPYARLISSGSIRPPSCSSRRRRSPPIPA